MNKLTLYRCPFCHDTSVVTARCLSCDAPMIEGGTYMQARSPHIEEQHENRLNWRLTSEPPPLAVMSEVPPHQLQLLVWVVDRHGKWGVMSRGRCIMRGPKVTWYSDSHSGVWNITHWAYMPAGPASLGDGQDATIRKADR